MHQTAKRCVQWAVGLWVLGAVVLIYGAQAYVWLADEVGSDAQAGLDAVDIVLTIARSALFPLGAVLIGAAVVIQTLAPGLRAPSSGLQPARLADKGSPQQ